MKTLAALRRANRARQLAWPGSDAADALFRAVEFGEEAGEVLGAVKKLTRAQRRIAGNSNGSDIASLRQNLMEEIGDAIIALDLLSDQLSIEPEECVAMKFNMTSNKVGVPVFMDEETWSVRTDA